MSGGQSWTCARCGRGSTGHQGHYGRWCSAAGRIIGSFHFCCPGDCALEADPNAKPTDDAEEQP